MHVSYLVLLLSLSYGVTTRKSFPVHFESFRHDYSIIPSLSA